MRQIEIPHWSSDVGFPIGLMPDNRRLVVRVREPGQPTVFHVVDLEAGTEKRITPEGMNPRFLARGGATVVAFNEEGWWKIPTEGGDPSPIRGVEDDEFVIALTADGRAAWVQKPAGQSAVISRVVVDSGRRERVHELTPPNLAGSEGVGGVRITSDGKGYAYGYTQQLSELYLVHGIR